MHACRRQSQPFVDVLVLLLAAQSRLVTSPLPTAAVQLPVPAPPKHCRPRGCFILMGAWVPAWHSCSCWHTLGTSQEPLVTGYTTGPAQVVARRPATPSSSLLCRASASRLPYAVGTLHRQVDHLVCVLCTGRRA